MSTTLLSKSREEGRSQMSTCRPAPGPGAWQPADALSPQCSVTHPFFVTNSEQTRFILTGLRHT